MTYVKKKWGGVLFILERIFIKIPQFFPNQTQKMTAQHKSTPLQNFSKQLIA